MNWHPAFVFHAHELCGSYLMYHSDNCQILPKFQPLYANGIKILVETETYIISHIPYHFRNLPDVVVFYPYKGLITYCEHDLTSQIMEKNLFKSIGNWRTRVPKGTERGDNWNYTEACAQNCGIHAGWPNPVPFKKTKLDADSISDPVDTKHLSAVTHIVVIISH